MLHINFIYKFMNSLSLPRYGKNVSAEFWNFDNSYVYETQ
jgi:hypothetical protein